MKANYRAVLLGLCSLLLFGRAEAYTIVLSNTSGATVNDPGPSYGFIRAGVPFFLTAYIVDYQGEVVVPGFGIFSPLMAFGATNAGLGAAAVSLEDAQAAASGENPVFLRYWESVLSDPAVRLLPYWSPSVPDDYVYNNPVFKFDGPIFTIEADSAVCFSQGLQQPPCIETFSFSLGDQVAYFTANVPEPGTLALLGLGLLGLAGSRRKA